MSARGKLQLFILVLLASVCVGFMAVVGMSAAAAPADDGGDQAHDSTDYDHHDEWPDERSDSDERSGDASRLHVNVHATEDVVTVTNRGEEPVDVTVQAPDGDRQAVLDPGETMTLPVPDEPSRVRVLAESDDARLEAIVTFEAYEYDCGMVVHSGVAPATIEVRWTAGDRSGERTHTFEQPEPDCPVSGTPGGEEPPEDPEAAYNETHDRVWAAYEDGNETTWDGYEMARAVLWGGYEDGRSAFWDAYERVTGDDDDDDDGSSPQDRVNETRDFGERVANDTRDGAERIGNDTQDGAERVANDTRDDVDRLREDAEEDRERLRDDVNETRDELTPDGGDDNESDGSPADDLPPEDVPPEDLPPEDVVPDDLLPEDVPPEDVPPGDDNGSDDGGLPEGDAVSADADADAGREGDTIYAEGGASVSLADDTVYVSGHDRFEGEAGSDA